MAAGNTFGTLVKLTLFGESHGDSVGGVLDGFPAGYTVNESLLKTMLQQRFPSASFETARREEDAVEFLSGLKNKTTLGSPIAFRIRNTNARPGDYESLKNIFRPGHADFVYHEKYGLEPQSGGGRASGRETAARVVAGALALGFLREKGIDIISYISAIGSEKMIDAGDWKEESAVFNSPVRCPDHEAESRMQQYLKQISDAKDSIGGCVTTLVRGLPAGLGEPVFGKLNAVLAQAIMSIPGAKGVDFGEGFAGLHLKGSEYNDVPVMNNGKVQFESNHSGGVQAGISNGNILLMKTAFRPASSVGTAQRSIDTEGHRVDLKISGRHDACFAPRASIVVTAMTAIVLMDAWLQFKSYDREF
jgi:chorismate synthase